MLCNVQIHFIYRADHRYTAVWARYRDPWRRGIYFANIRLRNPRVREVPLLKYVGGKTDHP